MRQLQEMKRGGAQNILVISTVHLTHMRKIFLLKLTSQEANLTLVIVARMYVLT